MIVAPASGGLAYPIFDLFQRVHTLGCPTLCAFQRVGTTDLDIIPLTDARCLSVTASPETLVLR
jgi:hypothetical protein